MLADEVDHLAIAVGSLSAVAARLMHHSEAVPAVVHIGEAEEQVACGGLGLVELGGANKLHHGIGGGIKRVLVGVFLLGPGEAGGDCCRQLSDMQAIRRGALIAPPLVVLRLGFDEAVVLGRLVLGETALLVLVATAAVAGIIASWLWGGLGHAGRRRRGEGGRIRCIETCWLTPHSISCCSPAMAISPTRRAPGDACFAAARCIRPATRASRGGGFAGSGPSMTGASASVVPSMAAGRGRRRHRCASLAARSISPVAILRHGVTTARIDRLSQAVGVDRRTVERWRRWWRERFPATPFWKVTRATFMPPIDHQRLPASLLERFTGDDADRLVALLRFIGPVTGGRGHAR
jgi:hypothetical protein